MCHAGLDSPMASNLAVFSLHVVRILLLMFGLQSQIGVENILIGSPLTSHWLPDLDLLLCSSSLLSQINSLH